MSDRQKERFWDPNEPTPSKSKRRGCRIPGCTNTVKSKGLCQRHGATAKRCKIEGCTRQAQGSFEGMCTAHFRIAKENPDADAPRTYPFVNTHNVDIRETSELAIGIGTSSVPFDIDDQFRVSVYVKIMPSSLGWKWTSEQPMPLATYLENARLKGLPLGWHRNSERVAQGLSPIVDITDRYEKWELDLIWEEILLLTGHPDIILSHLAHAWGRKANFHFAFGEEKCKHKLITTGEALDEKPTEPNQNPRDEISASLELSFMAFTADALSGSILKNDSPTEDNEFGIKGI